MPFRPGSFLDRAFGQKRSLPPPIQAMMGPYGVPFTFKPEESLKAYGDNVWLYGAVTKVAFEIARTKFKLRKVNSKGEVEYVERHQALETLRMPQPISGGKTRLTAFDLHFLTSMHVLLAGEGYWALDDRLGRNLGGAPRRIEVALPHYMYPRADKDTGDLLGYTYRSPQKPVDLPPEDVVHFRLPDPLNLYRGHAPTQAIRYSIDTHYEADLLNLSRIKNNAVPSGLIKPGQAIDDQKAKRWRDSWNQLYGGGQNAGKVAVLPDKAEFQELQLTPQELQYLEGKNANRDEILAAYGVGLEMLGKTESQTRANAETSVYVFMKFGVQPFLVKYADTLTNDYLPAFPGTDGLEFTFDDPVPENLEEKRANAESLFNGGALTPNERRQMFGLEPLNLPGMDEPYLPFNVMPVGQPPDPLTDPNTNSQPAAK